MVNQMILMVSEERTKYREIDFEFWKFRENLALDYLATKLGTEGGKRLLKEFAAELKKGKYINAFSGPISQLIRSELEKTYGIRDSNGKTKEGRQLNGATESIRTAFLVQLEAAVKKALRDTSLTEKMAPEISNSAGLKIKEKGDFLDTAELREKWKGLEKRIRREGIRELEIR